MNKVNTAENTAEVSVYVDWSVFKSIQIGATQYTKGTSHDGRNDTFNGYNAKTIAIPSGTKVAATGIDGRSWDLDIDGGIYCDIGNGREATFTVPEDVNAAWPFSIFFNYRYDIEFNGNGSSGWSIDDINPEVTVLLKDADKDAKDPKANVAEVSVYVDWSTFESIQIGDTTYTKGTNNDGKDDTFNGYKNKPIAIPGGTKIIAAGINEKAWDLDINGHGYYSIAEGDGQYAIFTVPENVTDSFAISFSHHYEIEFDGEWCAWWTTHDINANIME